MSQSVTQTGQITHDGIKKAGMPLFMPFML